MNGDDVISGMQQTVKRDIVERYLHERLIIEEEQKMVLEAAEAHQKGLARWQEEKSRLAHALLNKERAARFFADAGLPMPEASAGDARRLFEKPRGLTRCRKYRNLVSGLYSGIWHLKREINRKLRAALDLVDEVNRDIGRFEADHDFLSLALFMRSMEPEELLRRKIMGVNFNSKECALAAAQLSFKRMSPQKMGLFPLKEGLKPPARILPAWEKELTRFCRERPEKAAALWRKA